jgi:hypothetical protein
MPEAKILFLDIDGVVMPFTARNGIPEDICAELQQAKDDGWKFILHSTWRHGLLDQAYDLFATPGLHLDGHVACDTVCKRTAILDWLDENYGADVSLVVVFDDDDLGKFPEAVRFVRVKTREAFTFDALLSAVRQQQKEKP